MLAKYNYSINKAKKIDLLMKKKVGDMLDVIGEDISNKIKEYLIKYWYNTYSPKNYERTYSLLESVKYKKSRSYVTVYIDEEEFIYAVQGTELWNQHMGFDEERFGKGLIEFIEDGKFDSGKFGASSNPRIGNGSHVIKRINTWLKRYVDKEILKRIKMDLGL